MGHPYLIANKRWYACWRFGRLELGPLLLRSLMRTSATYTIYQASRMVDDGHSHPGSFSSSPPLWATVVHFEAHARLAMEEKETEARHMLMQLQWLQLQFLEGQDLSRQLQEELSRAQAMVVQAQADPQPQSSQAQVCIVYCSRHSLESPPPGRGGSQFSQVRHPPLKNK